MEATEPEGAENPPSPDAPAGGDPGNQPPSPPAESDPKQDHDDGGGDEQASDDDQEGEATPDNPMEPGDEAPSG